MDSQRPVAGTRPSVDQAGGQRASGTWAGLYRWRTRTPRRRFSDRVTLSVGAGTAHNVDDRSSITLRRIRNGSQVDLLARAPRSAGALRRRMFAEGLSRHRALRA